MGGGGLKMWFLQPKSQISPRISHNILDDMVKTQSHDTVYVEKKVLL
jgi:hypothetical protein